MARLQHDKGVAHMAQFTIICPECGCGLVTSYPEAMIWELCPRCRNHVWDRYDVWMAEEYRFSDNTAHAGICLRENN